MGRRDGAFGPVIARLVYSALLEHERKGPIRNALRRAMRAPLEPPRL